MRYRSRRVTRSKSEARNKPINKTTINHLQNRQREWGGGGGGERERERERERETDRQTDRQTDANRQTDRQIPGKIEKERLLFTD